MLVKMMKMLIQLFSKKQKQVFVLFVLTLSLMVLSFIPWNDLHVTIFSDFNTWLTGLPVVGKICWYSNSSSRFMVLPEGAMLFCLYGYFNRYRLRIERR